MSRRNKNSIGKCGEYYVAAELERRGFSVAITMMNTKDFDVLAINRITHKQWAIQVKTTTLKKNAWTLSEKNENIIGDNIIYVFVKINDSDCPTFHIVKSAEVAEYISKEHKNWLETLGKHGQQRKDNSVRKFEDKDNKYLSRWSLMD